MIQENKSRCGYSSLEGLKQFLKGLYWLNEDNTEANEALLEGLKFGFTEYNRVRVSDDFLGKASFSGSMMHSGGLNQKNSESKIKVPCEEEQLTPWQMGDILSGTRFVGPSMTLCSCYCNSSDIDNNGRFDGGWQQRKSLISDIDTNYCCTTSINSMLDQHDERLRRRNEEGQKFPASFFFVQPCSSWGGVMQNHGFDQTAKMPFRFSQEFSLSYLNAFQEYPYLNLGTNRNFCTSQYQFTPSSSNSMRFSGIGIDNEVNFPKLAGNLGKTYLERSRGSDCMLQTRSLKAEATLPDIRSHSAFPSLPEPLLDSNKVELGQKDKIEQKKINTLNSKGPVSSLKLEAATNSTPDNEHKSPSSSSKPTPDHVVCFNNAGRFPPCGFCRTNNEPEEVWKSHPLRMNDVVICPGLQKYKCAFCGITGSHTIKYCPKNPRGVFAERMLGYFSESVRMEHQLQREESLVEAEPELEHVGPQEENIQVESGDWVEPRSGRKKKKGKGK